LELESLKHELEVTIAKLREEHEQRLKAEAQLAAVQQEAVGDVNCDKAIRERLRPETRQMDLIERQMDLIERMELLLDKADGQGGRSGTANGWSFQLRTLLPSLASGILGGGIIIGILTWFGVQRQATHSPGQLEAPPAASPVQAQETVQFRCNQPCWLDIRTADSGKRVFSKLLKGSTANFAVGSGLDVFSGRADLVKVRINDGAEEPLLSGRVVGGRVIRPSGPP
jgi:hypothetical protein